MDTGIRYFQQALQKDPNYALAYAGLADSYNMLGWYAFVSPQEAMPEARKAAVTAVELDPLAPEAHASLALVKAAYEWDWAGGEKEFKEALRLNPSYETAYRWYGCVLDPMGRHEEAIAAAKRGEELDPIISSTVGLELYRARRYDQAVEQLRKAAEIDADYFPTHLWLAWAYLQQHIPEKALQEAHKSVVLSNNGTSATATLAISYAASGQIKEAMSILRSLEAASKSRYISNWELASIFASLNDTEGAFHSLQRAYEDHDSELPYLNVDARFDSLRSDPRYADLLRRMGLPQ